MCGGKGGVPPRVPWLAKCGGIAGAGATAICDVEATGAAAAGAAPYDARIL